MNTPLLNLILVYLNCEYNNSVTINDSICIVANLLPGCLVAKS